MSQLKQLIEKMILENLDGNLADDFKGLSYKKTYEERIDGPGEVIDGEKEVYYDILDSSRKKVGEVKHSTYFGTWRGHIYNKTFDFDGSDVRGGGDNPKKNMESWFKTKTFHKWVTNIDKYKSLKTPTNNYRLKSNKR
jgi:hypothetical protein